MNAQNKRRKQLEDDFAIRHRGDSDEALLSYLQEEATRLCHMPKKEEVIGFAYIKSRLGPWPRVLERAGLKKLRTKEKVE